MSVTNHNKCGARSRVQEFAPMDYNIKKLQVSWSTEVAQAKP